MDRSAADIGMPMDKSERIAARRARVEAKLAAKKAGDADGKRTQKKDERAGVGRGDQQLGDSRQRLDKLKGDLTDGITNIRVEGDYVEQERRINEEVGQQARQQRLQDEAATSTKRNAAISMKWNSLYEKNMPQDLLREIQAQKDACDRVIASKDRIIKEFQEELRSKDEEYVKSLKKQSEDFDKLLDRMHAQAKALQKAYEEELREIETAFMQERQELLDANRGEIDALFERRRQLEQQFMDKRAHQVEEDSKKMDGEREKDAEEYNILKMKLQTEIHDLEKQLEEMRARYQLNAEKLDYNYRVLSERVAENQNIITQHKRKLARLQDSLSSVMAKYTKTDKQYRQENNDLTDQYKRITEQFKDLQNKFRYFETADVKKYDDIWAMNSEIVQGLAAKVLECDRIVSEQQLGIEWRPYTQEGGSANPNVNVSASASIVMNGAAVSPSLVSPAAMILGDGSESNNNDESELDRPPSSAAVQEDPQDVALRSKMKEMIDLLCDEAGFLVEDRVQSMLSSLPDDERTIVKADSILRALGVESPDDISRLLPHFMRHSAFGDSSRASSALSRGSVSGGGYASIREPSSSLDGNLIPASQIMHALKSFIEEQQRSANIANKRAVVTRLEEKSKGERRVQEREFWQKSSNPIPETRYRLWQALEKGLENYNKLLVTRSKLVEETDAIAQQNLELKGLLTQYLTSKINEELRIPPTALLNTVPNK